MNIIDYEKYAWFSDLAYVNWSVSNTATKVEMIKAAKSSQAQRVPEKLGEKIFIENKENYSVLSFSPNDESGFKASLYGNGAEKVLAICGTEPFVPDLTQADIAEIGIIGFALHQSVGLFNYIMRLKAAPGESNVLQLKLMAVNDLLGVPVPPGVNYLVRSDPTDGVSDYYWFEASYTGKAEADNNPTAQLSASDTLTLTGHSLGGHLANFALRLFPDLFDQSVTFNAAGFDPVTAGPAALRWTDEFVDLFADFLPSPPASSFAAVADRLYVLESESSGPGNDLSFVASDACGFSPIDCFTSTSPPILNAAALRQDSVGLAARYALVNLNPVSGFEDLVAA